MSIASWITERSASTDIAFWFEGEPRSYGELAADIDTAARGLVACGVEEGDRVGYCGLNRIEMFVALFACARIGAIFLPFNNRLTAAELAVQVDDSTPALLLTTDGFGRVLREASAGRQVRDLDEQPFTSSTVELPGEPNRPEMTVLMVYTSGTTGQPKGAMLSHDAMLHTVLNSIDHQGLTRDDCIIAPLPSFHVGGINIQTLPTLFVGGQVVLMRRFDPGGVIELLSRHTVTQTLLVPAMLQAVAAQPGFHDADWQSLRGINTGSSIVPPEVMQPYFDLGVPVGQVYGSTETGPTAVVLDYDDAQAHIGSCGRAATHTELRIVNRQGGDVSVGVAGELWLRGANVFTGYWNNPQATAEAFADGGWFRTGDIGYTDADGFVTISDRIKDVVISGGENIYPAELEPILAQHPAIRDVAVIGDRDERWGEVPVAVVVLADGASLTVDELRAWCEGRLARFKHPRLLRVVADLPRTALGKVKKHELRGEA